ncbi:galactokinase, partial [Candidatus Poribacteria bacterium]
MRELIDRFADAFGSKPRIISRAPGRVNLIGEHTDYNDGFVLPIAIDRSVKVAASPRDDSKVVIKSLDFDETVEFDLEAIERDEEHPWSNYPRGVAHVLIEAGHRLVGMNAVVTGDVPIGAGLSSSAAIELAFAMAFAALSSIDIPRKELALLCQKAENGFVGVSCGIMDQFISAMGRKGCAMFLDCRSLEFELVPLDLTDHVFVVCDTKVKRELSGSEYNKRRAECEKGVELLKRHLPGIKALRDVTPEDFDRYSNELPETIRKRCRHVILENERVVRAVEALKSGDLKEFGELMNESHESLRVDYEVSCEELDLMVGIARG